MVETQPPQSPNRLHEAQDRFIVEWGRMSSSWGINRTMAQIHALLLVTGRPHTMEEICERLHISRGNASMNLRDLIDWNVVRRFRRPGDRKDLYISDTDAWEMVARVVRERKRREFDPTHDVLREVARLAPADDDSVEARVLIDRVHGLLEIFSLIDALYDQAFATDSGFREAIAFVRSTGKGASELDR